MTTYGLLTFEGMEELDLVGPWEVFTASAMARGGVDTVVTVGEAGPGVAVRCAKGLRITADHGLDDHPPLDVVLVPGGVGRKVQTTNPVVLDWLRGVSATATVSAIKGQTSSSSKSALPPWAYPSALTACMARRPPTPSWRFKSESNYPSTASSGQRRARHSVSGRADVGRYQIRPITAGQPG